MPATLTRSASRPQRFSLFATISRAHEIWRQRRALERLDATALRDIGLTQDDVRNESRRSIWDAPSNWRK